MRAEAAINNLGEAIDGLGPPHGQEIIRAPGRALTAITLPALMKAGRFFAGRKVALCLSDRFDLVLAMIALDGQAASIMPLASDLPANVIAELMARAGFDHVVSDRPDVAGATAWSDLRDATAQEAHIGQEGETCWVLTTSGTTGIPKLAWHRRAALARTVRRSESNRGARWGMLYDPGRFAGTQVIFQALLGGGTLLVPDSGMTSAAVIDWLVDEGCTHISATPSLWRRMLMAPATARLPLRQISLGGEIADDAILSALKSRFPEARVTHIYAATETGVGFSVQDGRAGFPVEWLGSVRNGMEIAVRDEILWLRPPGDLAPVAVHVEVDGNGFICTGDIVEQRGDRYYFRGREDASLNVGGVKIQVEAVEEVVHRHPAVAQCRITARPSSIMGNLLSLSIVPRDGSVDAARIRSEISQWCRQHLPRAAQPATIRIVSEIPVTSAGKTERAR